VTSGRHALLPAIGVNPTTGRVAIAYYTVRDAGINLELVESTRDGSDWSNPVRLSAATMRLDWVALTDTGRMLADYISVHYATSKPLVVWALASQPVGTGIRQAIYATRP
jgi:hypothetical protein